MLLVPIPPKNGQDPHLPLRMVDHNVMRFDVSMHDTLTVAEIQRLEQFKDVVSHVVVDESRVECSKICVVHVLEYQTGCFALAVAHNVEESDDIGSSRQVL